MRKRSLWTRWLIGAGAFFAVILAIATYSTANSPNAMMEAALAEVLDQYGFSEDDQQANSVGFDGFSFATRSDYDYRYYKSKGMLTRREVEEIKTIIAAACREATAQSVSSPHSPNVTINTGSSSLSIQSVAIQLENRSNTLTFGPTNMYSIIRIGRQPQVSFLTRVKNWLPW